MYIAQQAKLAYGNNTSMKQHEKDIKICERDFATGKKYAGRCDMHCGYGFCFPYQGSTISCDRTPASYPYGLTKFNAAGSTTKFMFDEWDAVHGLGYCAAVVGTGQYNCSTDLCTDRNKVCTNSAVRNMCDGTCDFCSLPAAVAANVTRTKKCYSGLKKYFSAATSQCFVNTVLDCDKDACQTALVGMRNVTDVTCAGTDLAKFKDFKAYLAATQTLPTWEKYCDACGSSWAGSFKRKNELCPVGCTNSPAHNFDPTARKDDGSCNHSPCLSKISCDKNGSHQECACRFSPVPERW